MNRKVAQAMLCAALGNIFWGFSFLFTRVGLDAVPHPSVMLSHRFLISVLSLSLCLCTGKAKVSFKGKNCRPIVLLMLLQLSYYLFETYGLLYTNTTIAGLVLAVVPVVTIGTGALFLKEYPTRRQALFCIIPVVGVIVMTVSGKELGIVNPLGIFLLLLTLLASALYKTVNRKAAQEFSAFERTFMVISLTSVFLTLTALNSVGWDFRTYAAPLLDGKYLFSVSCLSLLCSTAANLLVNYASGILPVFQVSSFGPLSTLCSMVSGVVFLKEPINIPLLVGAALILVGIHQVTKQKTQPLNSH